VYPRSRGFARGLRAKEILGANIDTGVLLFLMKWRGCSEIDLVPASEANIRCPQIVIKYYENLITFV
jgi:hypothetical protein